MQVKLLEIAEVIRSKNSGPYEITLDIIFRDEKVFRKVCSHHVFTPGLVAGLYGVDPAHVLNIIEFAPAKAIKINLKRSIPSGGLGETDVYGAQQHAPLLYLEFSLPEGETTDEQRTGYPSGADS